MRPIKPEAEPLPPVESNFDPMAIEPVIKMVVKTISAKYERKFNLGEYESASLEVSTWADIEPEQEPKAAINELMDLCKEQVRKQALPILRGRKNGGFEFAELQDKYLQLQVLLNEAINELGLQEPHDAERQTIVERFNQLTKGE
jgi:hypothetical protein